MYYKDDELYIAEKMRTGIRIGTTIEKIDDRLDIEHWNPMVVITELRLRSIGLKEFIEVTTTAAEFLRRRTIWLYRIPLNTK